LSPARAISVLLLSLLAACGSCNEPEQTATVASLVVNVPEDWTVELQRKDPVEQLALRPPRPTVLCRVIVMRGKGEQPAPTPAQFLASSKKRFGGTEHAKMSLDAPIGAIDGRSLHGVEMPEDLQAIGGDARVEVYATEHGDAMVGAVIGWFRGKPEDQHLRDECVGALETLRPAG